MSQPSTRPIVLVVAPGDQAYRGYALHQVAAAYDVVAITPGPLTWEQPLVVDHEIADPHDEQALLAAGRALAARHPLAGVFTWTEWHLEATARLAQALNLAGDTPQTMRNCRDKATSRTLFARHHVPSAASMRAASLLEAALAAEEIGYPVVLKPAGGAASIGVIRVNRAEELPDGYTFAATAAAASGGSSPEVLVEEYLDGPEISVECVTRQGQTTAVAVTRKSLGEQPYFEEIAHTVDAADPLLERVAPVAAAAIKALGITEGIQHVEMRLVAGRPRLIEVNGRIGGDMIGHLVSLATGVNLARAAADIACGKTPDLTPTRRRAAAIRLLYPERSGTLTARHLDETFAASAPWLEHVRFHREIGDPLVLPPEGDMFTARVGFLITTAPTAAVAQDRVRTADEHLTVTTEPLKPPTSAGTGGAA